MSELRNQAIKNFKNKEKHLYAFEVTCSSTNKGKGSRTYKPVQVYATCKGHAIDKAIKLHKFPVEIHPITILGQCKKSLEDRYFRRYGKVLTELYNI